MKTVRQTLDKKEEVEVDTLSEWMMSNDEVLKIEFTNLLSVTLMLSENFTVPMRIVS